MHQKKKNEDKETIFSGEGQKLHGPRKRRVGAEPVLLRQPKPAVMILHVLPVVVASAAFLLSPGTKHPRYYYVLHC